MSQFKKDDRVEIINHNSQHNGQIGTVTGIDSATVCVSLTSGPSMWFYKENLRVLPAPNVGDRVRVTRPTGPWTAQEGEVVGTDPYGNFVVDLDYDKPHFAANELAVIESFGPVRVEGQPIRFEDVKIGDVVEGKSEATDNGVKTVIFRTGTVGEKSNPSQILRTRGGSVLAVDGETIKLIKDIDNDQVMVALNELPRESILSFRTGTKNDLIVALKLGEDSWNVMHAATSKSTKTLALRARIENEANGRYTVVQRGGK